VNVFFVGGSCHGGNFVEVEAAGLSYGDAPVGLLLAGPAGGGRHGSKREESVGRLLAFGRAKKMVSAVGSVI
jgi:hypothetical protein